MPVAKLSFTESQIRRAIAGCEKAGKPAKMLKLCKGGDVLLILEGGEELTPQPKGLPPIPHGTTL